jgi:hypothetical protein
MAMPEPPPQPEGRLERAAGVVKGLSLSNVMVIALLAVIAVPVFVVWKAVGDDKLMDRLMSTYEEVDSKGGCVLRHVQARGGPDLWGISSGFAFQGADKWFVNVLLDHKPANDEEIASYCQSLKLIADRMLDRGHDRGDAPLVDQPGGDAEVQPGSVQSPETDGR